MRAGLLLLLVVLGVARPPCSDAVHAQAAFHVERRLVVLSVTVKNGRGELVTNLDQKAFTVLENGVPQPIMAFRGGDVPVSLGVLIDNSTSMRAKREMAESAALASVRASNAEDEAFVINFADKPRLDVPITNARDLLEAGIARTDSIGGTAMWDAVALAETYVAERGTRDRRVLLLITDGNDNASQATLSSVRSRAQRDGDAVYAIALQSRDGSGRARSARGELQQLATATGGVAYYPDSPAAVVSVAIELAQQIRKQYTMAYAPLNEALDGRYRRIRVVARGQERLVARTRDGYLATR